MSVNSFDSYPLTWIPDKMKLQPPYYLSLSRDLQQKIESGLLAPGTKLPPQREIADYLDLNYTTITRVYDTCKRMGLLYGVVGKGTYVAQREAEENTITAADLTDTCIELGYIHAFSEYSGAVEDAAKTVLGRNYLRTLFDYSSPTGHPHQRAAALRWLEQMGVHTDIDHVSILSGSQNALAVVLLSLFHPGDRIAVDPFTYPNFIELSKLTGIELVPVADDGDGMRPDMLDRLCRTMSLKGIYLMPSCANPTAISMPPARRQALAEVIRRNHLLLIEDDIAAWLMAAGGEKLVSLHDLLGGDSIYVCGMTKSLCPGLRIAYLCYGERFRERILHGIFNINIKTSSLDAEIITEMVLNGSAYRTAQHKRELTEKANRLFCSLFAGYEPSLCYYRWLPIPNRKPGVLVEKELQMRGIRVYHADRFAVSAREKGAPYLRLALCSAGNMQRLKKGLTVLRDYLYGVEPV